MRLSKMIRKLMFAFTNITLFYCLAISSALASNQQISLIGRPKQSLFVKLGAIKSIFYTLRNNTSKLIPLNITTSKNLRVLNAANTCSSNLRPFASCNLRLQLKTPLKVGVTKAQLTISSHKKILLTKLVTFHVDGMPGLKIQTPINSPLILKQGAINFVNYKLLNASSKLVNGLSIQTYGENITRDNNTTNNCSDILYPGESCNLRFRVDVPRSAKKISMKLFVKSASGMKTHQSDIFDATSKELVWKQVQGPYSRKVVSVAVDPDNCQIAYAITPTTYHQNLNLPNQYLYKTIDGGYDWQKVNFSGLSFTDIYQVLVGTGGVVYVNTSLGLLKSKDGGKTWVNVSPSPGLDLMGFTFLLLHQGVLYAATTNDNMNLNGGVVESSDGGRHWKLILKPRETIFELVMKGNVIYASGVYGDIYKSVNAGASWTKLNSLPSPILFYQGGYALAITSNAIFAEGPTYDNNVLYKSIDGGAHWINLSSKLPQQYNIDGIVADNQTLYAFTNTNADGSPDAVLTSRDGGESWQMLKTSGRSLNVDGLGVGQGLPLAGVGATTYLATQSGVYKSLDNGMQWIRMVHGMTADFLPSSLLKANNTIFAFPSRGGVFSTSDSGISWSPRNDGITIPVANTIYHYKIGNALYVIGYAPLSAPLSGSQYLFRSDDDGLQWNGINLHFSGSNSEYIDCLAGSGNTLFAAGWNLGSSQLNSNLFKSTDAGLTWHAITTPQKWFVDPFANEMIAVHEKAVYVYNDNGFFISKDDGNSWSQIDKNFFNGHALGRQILFYKNTIFILLDDQLYKSVNDGINWTPVYVFNPIVESLICVTQDGSNLYVLTNKGIYQSKDTGIHWQPIASKNFPPITEVANETSGEDLLVDGNTFYLATNNDGLFKAELGSNY